MKNVKIIIVMLFVALSVTACGSMSNMSEQDAYDIGYGIGKAAGYMLH